MNASPTLVEGIDGSEGDYDNDYDVDVADDGDDGDDDYHMSAVPTL